MDEAFMNRVAERIAAATEAVSSVSPTADPAKLPAVQTMDEWMAAHSPGAKQRCGDCKAPLVEGSTTICIACGRQLPPRLAVKQVPFSFDTSLARKLFYESVHLEDPHDTSADTTEVPLRASSSGTIANGYSEQQPRSGSGFGVVAVENSVQGGGDERGVASAGDSSDPAVPSSSSKPLKDEDEDYIWGSADADDFGARAWSQQLKRSSSGDPQDFSSAPNSTALNAANITLDRNPLPNDDDFFAVASVGTDLSLSRSLETDLNVFFPSAFDAVNQTRSEQASTAGASSFKQSSDSSVGKKDFHFFAQTPPLTDPKVQPSDADVVGRSTDHTEEKNFDDFFKAAPRSSTDQSHRGGEASISGEQSNAQNLETDFDDFFQGVVPKAGDHSNTLNPETRSLHTEEESSSHTTATDFDGFFHSVSQPAGHTGGLNLEIPTPHTAEESSGQDGRFEPDFDDFFQAPSSANRSGGSSEQPPVRHSAAAAAGDSSGQREEPHFDFFFQTSPIPTAQPRGPGVDSVAPHSTEKPSGQNLGADFDFFFQTSPVPGDQLQGRDAEAKESSRLKVDNHFDNFFQVPRRSGEQDHGQSAETAVPVSAAESSNQSFRTDFDDLFQSGIEAGNHPGILEGETLTPQTGNGSSVGHDGEADFDDFFQAAPTPPGSSPGQTIETDFHDFFGASPEPVKASGAVNGATDFDFFFPMPRVEDRLHTQHAKSSNSDSRGKANGEIVEPDFDEFFHSDHNSVNHSHAQKVTTSAPRLATESVSEIDDTYFEGFFQGAPKPISQPNGHLPAVHPDFFQPAPRVKEVPGQNVSVGFDAFFSSPPVNKSSGRSVTKDVDPFLQADPLSVERPLDQNGTADTDVDNGDFDDFVQAAPQSADKVSGPSQTTEFDSFFQARPRSMETAKQSLTTDFDDFFQTGPRIADKPPNVHTETPFEFFKTSLHQAEKSHFRKASTDFADLFQVSLPRTDAPKRSSSASGLSGYGNGSVQHSQAGVNSTSTLRQGRSSSSEDFLKQLEGLHLSQGPSQAFSEPPKKMANPLSDTSFRLADHLVLSDEAPKSMWSFN